MDEVLIAPCGMNCNICRGYLALTHEVKRQGIQMSYCKGCRPRNKNCAFLKKKCGRYLDGRLQYCYQCPVFPCESLSRLDRRYRTNYRMSMIENLKYIKHNGVEKFLVSEEAKWRCPKCGGIICCHNGICFSCGLAELKSKENKYRWEEAWLDKTVTPRFHNEEKYQHQKKFG